MKNIYKDHQVKQSAVFALIALFFGVVFPSLSYSYNWPWDQGHDACTSLDGGKSWGLIDYDGKQQGHYSTKECCQKLCKACPVYANTGQLQKTFTDLTVPGIGPSLRITRTYNSQDWATAMLGNGWTFNFGRKLIISRTKDGEKRIGVLRGTGEKNFFRENLDGSIERITEYGVPYSLFKNSDNTYTILQNNGTSYELREDGKISRIVDRNLNALTFTYNSVGCISRITNATGNYVDFVLGPNGKIASVNDNLGRTISYSYDENGNLVSVTDPLGNSSQYVYNNDNLLTQFIDARGNVTETITYDTHQPPRVATFTEKGETFTMVYADGYTQKTDSMGNRWTYYYNDLGIIERIVDPLGNEKKQHHNKVTATSLDWEEDLNGNRTTYTYDAGGNITSETDPLGNTTTYTYVTGTDLVAKETNPLGVVTKYEYDSNGNLTKLIRDASGPLENATSYTYDSHGLQTSMTDPLGNTTSHEYDAAGNLTKYTNPLGNIWTYTYDVRGNMLTATDPVGNTNTYSYDMLGNLLTASNALGNITTYAFDHNGNLTRVQLPNGVEITYEYDTYNRLVKSNDPAGNTQTYAYDHNDNQILVTDANGHSTRYTYDILRRRTSVIDAEGHQTILSYNAVGNVVAVTDANGNSTHFTYDALNRMIQKKYPDGASYTYTFDALGRKISQTDANGNTINYNYDRLNRLVQKHYPDGTTADFSYDMMDRMINGINSDSSLGYTYDAIGHVISSIQNGKTILYGYNAAGNRVSMITPEGEIVQYVYNNANFMDHMQLSSGKGITYTYDAMGRITRKDYSGGAFATWIFDPAGRLTNINYSKSDGTTIFTQANSFDSVGNILQKTTGAGSTAYTYDKIYQLINADHSVMSDEHFTYDSAGNRLTSADYSNWSYNNRNQLSSYDGVSYSYDPNGNTISKTDANGTIHYQYNYENRMIRVDLPGGGFATFKYDVKGRRTEKNVNGIVTKYLYTRNSLLGEYDASGNLQRNYFYGVGDVNPSILTESGQIYFYLKDHLDTPQKVVDEVGNVGWSADYESFGKAVVTVSIIINNFRFAGQYFDTSTGLHYNWHRYYDSVSGRYFKSDPIGFSGGINYFLYVANNPINWFDPLGLFTLNDAKNSLKKRGITPANKGFFWDSYSDSQIFNEWLRLENSETSWLSNLPDCPCTTECIDSKLWGSLTSHLHGYHVGATKCMRSKPVGGHANQCCYDSKGKLITGLKSGSGSADFAPGSFWTFLKHKHHDMDPADLATKLDNGKWGDWSKKYLLVRPQVGGNNCP